jgi:hypothetical protein
VDAPSCVGWCRRGTRTPTGFHHPSRWRVRSSNWHYERGRRPDSLTLTSCFPNCRDWLGRSRAGAACFFWFCSSSTRFTLFRRGRRYRAAGGAVGLPASYWLPVVSRTDLLPLGRDHRQPDAGQHENYRGASWSFTTKTKPVPRLPAVWVAHHQAPAKSAPFPRLKKHYQNQNDANDNVQRRN